MATTNIQELHQKVMDAKQRGFAIHKMLKEINVPPGSFYKATQKAGLSKWRELKPSGIISPDEIKMPKKLPVWWDAKELKRKRPCAIFVVPGKMLPEEFHEDLITKL